MRRGLTRDDGSVSPTTGWPLTTRAWLRALVLPLACWLALGTSPRLFADETTSVHGGALSASDATSGDLFGASVAVGGQHGIVGAPGRGEAGYEAGAVYAFRRAGAAWAQTQKILPPAPSPGAKFGASVSLSGTLMLVGAPGAHGGANRSGAAYLFHFDGTNWVLARTLHALDAVDNDRFGHAVAIVGSELFVAAVRKSTLGHTAGQVYAYELQGGTLHLRDKVFGSAVGAGSQFGWDLAFDGRTLIVGAPGEADSGAWSGAAYAFEREGVDWHEVERFVASDGHASAFFGSAVHVEGTRIGIGSYGESSGALFSGAAYVYEDGPSGWRLDAKLKARVPLQGAQFGRALHFWGRSLAVGARLDPTVDVNAGRVFVFRHQGSNWEQRDALDEPTPGFNHWYGAEIDGARGQLLVGAPHSTLGTMDSGAVHALSLQTGYGFCHGDGASTMCPCGNLGPVERGCSNSIGRGAELVGAGSNRVADDDLEFFASGMRPGVTALLVAGDREVAVGQGSVFGDGLGCIEGLLRGLGTRSVDMNGEASWAGDLTSLGGWQAGDTVYFQVVYRDAIAGPCGQGFNTSSGYRIDFSH